MSKFSASPRMDTRILPKPGLPHDDRHLLHRKFILAASDDFFAVHVMAISAVAVFATHPRVQQDFVAQCPCEHIQWKLSILGREI